MSGSRVRHCDFYGYQPGLNEDDYEWVHGCCGGPWEERPEGHYADCPTRVGQDGEHP